MSGYIGPIPVPQGIQNKETFTATAAQTTFNTNGYTDGAFISVYLNGVRLINGTDYTATNGSDFVLTQAASVSDVVDFESFNSFSLASQQFENITTKNPTHEDTDGGRESALSFQGEQSGGEISTLAAIQASHDGTADDQKGDLIFKTNDGSDNNAPTERLRIDSDGSIVPATLGTSNVKLGLNAGKAIASGGNYNTVIGEESGASLSTGDVNTFVGYQSGDATTTSGNNVGVGYASLTTNILSSKNVAIGNNALKTHNLGSAGDGLNVAVGHGAGEEITTGISNTLIGANVGDALTDADYNVAIGFGALSSDTKGDRSVAIGLNALTTQNFTSVTTTNNTAVGDNAGYAVTTGTNNTLIGSRSGDAITSGLGNVAVGDEALSTETQGQRSIGIGVGALFNQNTTSATDVYNTAVGHAAGNQVTSGTNNTLVGRQAGLAVTTGSANTYIGPGTMGTATSGSNNTVIGGYNGNQGGFDLRTASNSIVLSDGAGTVGFIYDGAESAPLWKMNNSVNGNWTCRMVHTSTSTPYGIHINYPSTAPNGSDNYPIYFNDSSAARFFVFSNGNVVNTNNSYGAISDIKLKENITDASSQWDDVKAIKIKKYSMKADKLDAPNMMGVIAQDLETSGMDGLVQETIDRDDNMDDLGTTTKSVKYSILYMKAIKALQEAMTRIETLESENTAIKDRLDALEAE